MPIYDFFCDKCEIEIEIVQSIKEYTGLYNCTACGNPARRIYSHCSFNFIGTKIEDAEFNPGLGKVTKSKRHRDELAKQMGVVEIGNENPDRIEQALEKERTEKLKKSWEKVDIHE